MKIKSFYATFFMVFAVIVLAGCGIQEDLNNIINADLPKKNDDFGQEDDYYEKFYKEVAKRSHIKKGTSDIKALDGLPKDPSGNVNWTAAVVNGYISPRGSLDPAAQDDLPLNLNIFIEAKVPLMANVMFPHSIHTYWLSCNNCHPKIFIPEAGANPISMDEIFKGQWCGRCHGKVAFTFWPRENCVRCHIVLKGQSLERESYK
ncbi:MAG: cytochrome c3 family protein [Deltaproteobacteria bacterium]|nr:cytochrome c3 family protein [Deltaproteobacteria bacterium]